VGQQGFEQKKTSILKDELGEHKAANSLQQLAGNREKPYLDQSGRVKSAQEPWLCTFLTPSKRRKEKPIQSRLCRQGRGDEKRGD